MKQGNCEYIVCEKMTKLMRTTEYSPDDIRLLDPIMHAIVDYRYKGKPAFSAQFGYFVEESQFDIVEDTSRHSSNPCENLAVSIVWEGIAIAALSELTKDEIEKHISGYRRFASREELNALAQGEHSGRLEQCKKLGFDFCKEQRELSISSNRLIGKHGGLRIQMRKQVGLSLSDFVKTVFEILRPWTHDFDAGRKDGAVFGSAYEQLASSDLLLRTF